MVEGLTDHLGQGKFAGVAKGGVAQIVTHGDGLRQILVQRQGSRNRPGNPGDLQCMGHTGAVMVTFRGQKHLGLMHQPAEGLGVDDPVRIPLIAGAHIGVRRLFRGKTATALVGKGCFRA